MVTVEEGTELSWRKDNAEPKQCWTQVCVGTVKCSHFDSISTHGCHFLYTYNILRLNFKQMLFTKTLVQGVFLCLGLCFCGVASDFLMITCYDLIFI